MDLFGNHNDFRTSLEKALDETDSGWRNLPGLIIAGTHAPSLVEGKIDKLKEAREGKLPTLGICFGMQLMAVEYVRNVLGLAGANTAEVKPDAEHKVVVKMPKLRVGIFKVKNRYESFWHNYKVADEYLMPLSAGWEMHLSDDVLAEMRLKEHHPFYFGVQFHPEYGSSTANPHPLIKEFIETCKRN